MLHVDECLNLDLPKQTQFFVRPVQSNLHRSFAHKHLQEIFLQM